MPTPAKFRPSMVLREIDPRSGLTPVDQLQELAQGRALSWVYVTGSPGFYYGGKFLPVNDQWIDGRLRAHEQLTDGGYEPPVIAEHSPDGFRLGDLVRLAKYQTDEGPALAALVRWSLPDAKAKIDQGQIKYFSPGIGLIEHSETGEQIYVVKELSLTSAPHQKGAPTHILAKEGDPPMPTVEELDKKITDIGARCDKMSAGIEAMQKQMAEMTAPKMAEPPAPPAPPAAPAAPAPPAAPAAPAVEAAETYEAFCAKYPAVVALGEAQARALHATPPTHRAALMTALMPKATPAAPPATPAAEPPKPRKDGVVEFSVLLKECGGDHDKALSEYRKQRSI